MEKLQAGHHQRDAPAVTDPRKFKAPYNPKKRIWQEVDPLRTAHPKSRSLPMKVPDLAEFYLSLAHANRLREQLYIRAPQHGATNH